MTLATRIFRIETSRSSGSAAASRGYRVPYRFALRKRWEELTPRVRPTPTEVAFIFEASERGDALVQRYFTDIVVTIAGNRVPIHLGIMPKWAGDEALDVADFIIHTAGTQARNWDTGDERLRRDFKAIFHANPLWQSFSAIASVH